MAKLKTVNPYGDDFFHPDTEQQRPQSDRKPANTGVGTIRLNIDLDRNLHRQLKRLALDQDRTLADVVRGLISDALTKNAGTPH